MRGRMRRNNPFGYFSIVIRAAAIIFLAKTQLKTIKDFAVREDVSDCGRTFALSRPEKRQMGIKCGNKSPHITFLKKFD